MSRQAAQEIISHCPSCKLDLNHVIVALDGPRIVRVICLTCRKEHAYHRPKDSGSAPQKTARTPRPARTKQQAPSRRWSDLMAGRREEQAKPYSIAGAFSLNDKIDHPKFGLGFVTRMMAPNKMEVLFEWGPRILARGD